MDRRFLEFMGKWLLEAARGQKQIEDMAKWMGGGFSNPDEFSRMVRKFYGLEESAPSSAGEEQSWEKASEDLQKSYRQWLDLLNVAPKSEVQSLEKKCRALEEKIASQDETIRHLQKLLSEKGLPCADTIRGFTELMEKQGRQFRKLMESMGTTPGTD